jgi:hypothetical protein
MAREMQKKTQISASIDNDVWDWVLRESSKEGRSFSVMVNRLLRKTMQAGQKAEKRKVNVQ